jgi:hypothetical protein
VIFKSYVTALFKRLIMSDEPARYEINRKVRNILVSHNADMTKISYTCSCKTINIYGSLFNNDMTEFNITTIKAMVSDLMNIPSVQTISFNLDNWVIVAEPGELIIMKGRGLEQQPWIKE